MTWPTIYVQAAFGADPRSAPSSMSWTDLATYCTSLDITSPRRSRLLDRFSAGSIAATFDNSDSRFDPTNLSGPYVSGGRTQIVPNLPIRCYVNYSGTDYYLAVGYRDSGRVESQFPKWSEAAWQATDGFKLLGRLKRQALTAAVGDDETTGDRVARILDSAGWNASDRVIATGLARVQGTLLAGGVLDELQLTADAEGGDVYLDGYGNVVFRDRSWRASSTTWTVADTGSTEHTATVVADDDEQLINWASVTRIGGTPQVAEDTTSQGRYSLLSSDRWERTNQTMMTDPDAKAIADMVVGLRADTIVRFESITLDPTVNDNLWPMVLGMELGDRVSITDTPVSGSAVTRSCFIEGWRHSVTPGNGGSQGVWTTEVFLSDATAWDAIGTLAVWDSATWGTSKWFY